MTPSDKKYAYKVSLGSHDSRLKREAAKEVVDYCYAPRLKGPMPVFEFMIQYNLAHILELYRHHVISKSDASKILETLLWMRKQGLEHFEIDPKLESLMPNLEAILISKVGADVGGQVLTGRSRGEVETVAGILLLRSKLLDLLDETHQLRKVILEIAKKHTHTVMPGYTHLQHAQPTTLGHYMAAVAEALETDCRRLEDTYQRVNRSPAEAGTGWGSSYPIDRKRLADLLGFEGIIENTRYAYSSVSDKAIEMVASLSILTVTLNRFTEDIYFWCTSEYNLAEVADEYAGTSYIMPQKKNVTALQHYTCLLNRTIATFIRLTSQASRSSFGIAAHLAVAIMGSTPEALNAIEDNLGALRLLRGLVATLSFNEAAMKDRAGKYFTQGTELSDTLFREKGIAFRTAHRIVGALVREAVAQGKTARDIDEQMLNNAAMEVMGKPIKPPYDNLWKVLDPMGVVKAHHGLGAVAPEAVEASLRNRIEQLNREVKGLRNRRQRLAKARQILEGAVQNLITSEKK
jgi:argininosuccinate lyase